MKIAAILDEQDYTSTFMQPGKVIVYEKEKNSWTQFHQIEFKQVVGISQLREKIEEIVKLLEDCSVFVAKQATGIPYTVLDRAGFNVWELEGKPSEFLDYVQEQEEKEENGEIGNKTEIEDRPIEIEEGHFFISLPKVMAAYPEKTSKQILLPFLNNVCFKSLEVQFSHLPPWFEKEIPRLGFRMENQIEDNRVRIYP
jgi:Fe-only nitrogenase accessory protein AnfO